MDVGTPGTFRPYSLRYSFESPRGSKSSSPLRNAYHTIDKLETRNKSLLEEAESKKAILGQLIDDMLVATAEMERKEKEMKHLKKDLRLGSHQSMYNDEWYEIEEIREYAEVGIQSALILRVWKISWWISEDRSKRSFQR